jgi:hypothetical protein
LVTGHTAAYVHNMQPGCHTWHARAIAHTLLIRSEIIFIILTSAIHELLTVGTCAIVKESWHLCVCVGAAHLYAHTTTHICPTRADFDRLTAHTHGRRALRDDGHRAVVGVCTTHNAQAYVRKYSAHLTLSILWCVLFLTHWSACVYTGAHTPTRVGLHWLHPPRSMDCR